MNERTILHVDANNFYASVECMLHPELRGYPIAVCGDVEERHGIVLAKNYSAKAYGISTGEAIWQAKQKCKDLIIVPPHYDDYMKISKAARDIYCDYTDKVEPFGMDECWLQLWGKKYDEKDGINTANAIRDRIKVELGITVSVGVSFNKVFAKLGSDLKKPDAVTVVPKDSFQEKIWGLPASDMLGVGRATEKKLASVGIRTIGDVATWPVEYFEHFRYRRNQDTHGITVPLMVQGEDGFEHEYDPIAMRYEDKHFTDPFIYGFDDPRLQKIWDQADDTDKLILRYLSEGYTQRDIATKIGITQAAISLRLTKLKK